MVPTATGKGNEACNSATVYGLVGIGPKAADVAVWVVTLRTKGPTVSCVGRRFREVPVAVTWVAADDRSCGRLGLKSVMTGVVLRAVSGAKLSVACAELLALPRTVTVTWALLRRSHTGSVKLTLTGGVSPVAAAVAKTSTVKLLPACVPLLRT